jgi:antitoxin (DNA-binding transcriptional repressor) of toxin-antitoxin stability system
MIYQNQQEKVMANTVSKSSFKPRALEYFRQIQEQGSELIITDHAKPVIKISPFRKDPHIILEELRNSVIQYDDPCEPVGQDDWDIS